MTTIRARFAWSLVLGLAAQVAAAQDSGPSLEDLLRQEPDRPSADVAVSTAARLAQSSAQAPGVTRVVTRQDIQRLGLRTLADVLRLFPGLYLAQDDLFTQMGVRGIGRPGDLNARILFLLDGLRLNENIYDAGQVDEDFVVDVSEIERVEFTSGSGSALYGNNAFLGVVQVFTRRADPSAAVRVRWRWDGPQRFTTHLSAGHRLDSGAEWGFSATRMRARRQELFDALPAYAVADQQRLNEDRADKLNLRWIQGGLRARLGAVDRIKGFPVELGISVPAGLAQAVDRTRIHWGQVQWEQPLGDSAWLQLGAARQQLLYRYDEPFQSRSGRKGVFRFETLGLWDLVEARAGGAWTDQHEWMLGVEGQNDRMQRIRYFVLGDDDSADDARHQRWGFWVQDVWRQSDNQRWVLGWRADRLQGQGWRTHPRVAYVWSPAEGRQLKLSYGGAFRAPNRSESLHNSSQDLAPPPAERVRSLELAWEAPLGERWRGRWVVYGGRVRNLIDAGPDDAYYSASPPVRSRGLEWEVEGRWRGGASVQASVAVQQSRYAGGERLSNSPTALARLRFSLPLGEAWRLSVHGEAVGARRVDDERIAGYGVWHANVVWHVEPQWDVFLGVRNLADRRYWDAPAVSGGAPIEQHGRQAHMGVEWRFRP
ncbi:TonB-dependent receptor plug domain-containing protein [Inhella gelatinilytica]|uniref:TonB-dependent receptor n=1 Tax=Inhella gelatinilytica TaxID=2795030 RepID=A0A931IX85_9BURK|nr:TonB-dependent receptor [Inhella gelatinilytica]MBH9552734.1 TonB-dependent receptor [Inhella gelatinilytica]